MSSACYWYKHGEDATLWRLCSNQQRAWNFITPLDGTSLRLSWHKMDMPEPRNLKNSKKKLAADYDEFDELPQIFLILVLAHQGLDNLLGSNSRIVRQNARIPLCIQKTKWPKKKSTMALMKTGQPLISVGDDDAVLGLVWWKLERFSWRISIVMKRSWNLLVNCAAWGWWSSPARGKRWRYRPIGKLNLSL